MNNRRSGATICLMLLCTAVSAQQAQTTQPPVVSGQPAPIPPAPKVLPAGTGVVTAPGASVPAVTPALPVQPLPIPPLVVKPMADQPVLVEPLPDPRPGAQAVPPTLVHIATVPAAVPLVTPDPTPKPLPPPLGSELRNKLKVDEQHYIEKSASAKHEFDLREAAEKKEFEATLADKGFWERRRLARAFRAEQAKRRAVFNDEQEAKRRTYEWRYP